MSIYELTLLYQLCDQIEYDPNITDTCSNNVVSYDSICVTNYNHDSDNEFVFDNGNGCKDGYPYYYDSTNEYYLHYIAYTVNEWIISSSVTSVAGIAYCEKEDIVDCVSNSWYIEKEDGDSIVYKIDSNMIAATTCTYTTGNNGDDDDDDDDDDDSDTEDEDVGCKQSRMFAVNSVIFVFLVCSFVVCL